MIKRLSKENIAAIEKILNSNGATLALVKVEDGKPIVLALEKKRIS